MNIKNTFKDSERAVSPVIGVILMVAITVILAAVIGTFVLGLGDSLDDGTPQATFNIGEIDDGADTIELRKTAGADIPLSDIRVVVDVEDDDGIETTDFDLGEVSNDDDWRSGDRATITLEETDSTLNVRGQDFDSDLNNAEEISPTDEITITIIHKPSGGTISERSATV